MQEATCLVGSPISIWIQRFHSNDYSGSVVYCLPHKAICSQFGKGGASFFSHSVSSGDIEFRRQQLEQSQSNLVLILDVQSHVPRLSWGRDEEMRVIERVTIREVTDLDRRRRKNAQRGAAFGWSSSASDPASFLTFSEKKCQHRSETDDR